MDTLAKTIFNLIAELYKEILKFSIDQQEIKVSEVVNDSIKRIAKELVIGKEQNDKAFFDDNYCVNPQKFNDIISKCKEENKFLLYKFTLCELDMLIDIDKIIKKYEWNSFIQQDCKNSFESLNDNCNETGVLVIPKVPSAQNTIAINIDGEIIDKKYKTANYFYDVVNDKYNNIICIEKSKLSDYKICNVIVKATNNPEKKSLKIGVTPGCNKKTNELMTIEMLRDENTGEQTFFITEYLNSDFLLEIYKNALLNAKEHDVDILIGSEMLGVDKMMSVDTLGFNEFFVNLAGKLPSIFITPTYWANSENYLNVYLGSGEKIGSQYKQHKFSLKDKNGEEYNENLCNTPKEILLLHIPYVGRIVFPICVDLLHPEYMDILIRHLKADIVLCPSYTPGESQFGNTVPSMKAFGVRTIWFNSCSAINGLKEKPKDIGIVSVPVIGPSSITNSETLITPECEYNCRKTCLFIIEIQLKSEGDGFCNTIKIEHIYK